jgi:hypothetical protein
MAAERLPDDELRLDVQAYYDHSGNRSEAARARGLKRQTYSDRLRVAQQRLGFRLGKVADGRVEQAESVRLRLPRKGHVKRYILTSAQNNTRIHPGFHNLVALAEHWDGLAYGSCELIVGTFSYQLATYGPKAVKRGTHDGPKIHEKLWYDPELEPYFRDESVELAPGLVWCGEQNILPTNKWPLAGMETYNGRRSNIVPHATISMESVASMADEATKFNYSTGTVTQRNYIQKRAGILAEQRHDYGALVAEVDHNGSWWVRQLYIDDEDAVIDLRLRVQAGQVEEGDFVEALNHGDVHATELELWVREAIWGEGGMLDELEPSYQFVHDVFSMRSRSHHEAKNFHRSYAKHVDGEESVEEEVSLTADLLVEAERDWCETVAVDSNHDRHLVRWLNDEDPRNDPVNAKYFHLLQYHMLDAMDRGEGGFSVLEWALRRAGCPEDVRFLAEDESFVICRDWDGGVECGLHGDRGTNGARGSTRALTKLGRAVNKGHDHVAAINGPVFSAGACSLDFPYMKGPNSHSVSSIVTYVNGRRAILTLWDGGYRA